MFGVSSMTATLKKVAVKAPGLSLLNADPKKWHYTKGFNPSLIEVVHNIFVKMLEDSGAEVYYMRGDDYNIADSVFTYDASLMTPSGAILMSPGKLLRRGEQNFHKNFYHKHTIPIIGSIDGNATAEAGDTLWIDNKTLIIGHGFRTNLDGIEQLRKILNRQDINVYSFDLPFYSGESSCLHLMSLISLVDTRTALVCLPLVPVGLIKLLQKYDFTIIEAPFDEFKKSGTLSVNVLATKPGECIMIDSAPKTLDLLRSAGVHVKVFHGDPLCIACEGGPTCLTRPLLRTNFQ